MTRCFPYRGWLLAGLLASVAVSAVAPFDRQDWLLEHLPTATVLAFLVWYERRRGGEPLSDLSYTLLFALLMLHVIGAHYLYSRVPYDEWCQVLAGVQPSTMLGATRNHYDRLVHLGFGLLATLPVAELVRRHVTPSRVWAIVVAVAFVAVLSKLYELAEWLIALAMSPDAVENYNGQQGDIFDAQKDMVLALAGSILSTPLVSHRLARLGAQAGPPHRHTFRRTR